MTVGSRRRAIQLVLAGGIILSTAVNVHAQAIDWAKIDGILGRTGGVGGPVHNYKLPRSDLRVKLDGVAINPNFALSGFLAFLPMRNNKAMVMGDLVLLQSEVSPVMAKLIEGGVDVTAIHNHLLRAEPLTFYMHVGAHGDPVKIAQAVHEALEVSKTPLTAAPAGQPLAIDFDTAQIEQILGAKGATNDGIFAVNIPRRDPIIEMGMNVGVPMMGGANAFNFQPTGGGKAAITGDFLLIGSEVPDVIHTLRSNGIEVTALHGHMLTEEPRIFFLHFWANGDALKLARGLKAALDKTASAAN
jgi:hypothetical protein